MKSLLRKPTAIVFGLILLCIFLVAVFANTLAPYSADQVDLLHILQPPNAEHLLGTDNLGRDILSRLMVGAQITLLGALIGTVTAIVLGAVFGLIAGYSGGRVDDVLTWVFNLLLSLPIVIVVMAFVVVTGPNILTTMVLVGVLVASRTYRVKRAAVKKVRGELYIDAAQLSGLSHARIIGRHVLLVIRSVIIVQAPIIFGAMMLIQAGLDFLGLTAPGSAAWGAMLADASTVLFQAPWLVVWPGLAISLTVISLMLFANALRDALDGSRARGGEDLSAQRAAAEEPAVMGTPDDGDAILSIRDMVVTHQVGSVDVSVVDGVSFAVRRGETLGLVGESGSGKTQTILAALGLLSDSGRISRGSVVFDGVELSQAGQAQFDRVRQSRIGYVSQDPLSNLDPSFTIGSQLTEPMRHHLKVSKSEAKRRALDLLDRVGIVDPERVFRSYAHQVSGGMAQRILIAAAICCEPDLLVADEPTTALDVTVQAEILDLLRSLREERGMAIVIVTHDLGVIADLADRVVVMRYGRVVEDVPAESLFYEPARTYSRRLLEAYDPDKRRVAAALPAEAPRLLEVENLGVTYRRPGFGHKPHVVLEGVSLHLDAGETLGLVGESGSGKTTLGRAVLGLVPTMPGTVIRWFGDDATGAERDPRHPLHRDIQAIFQDPYSSLNPAMSIDDILVEPMLVQDGPAKVSRRDAQKRIRELLDRVSLPSDTGSRRASELSGGQRQRVAIARALVLDPKLIVCDEPVSALDATTQAQVLDLLSEIQRDTGVSYLFISHDLAVVRQVSHRVAVMSRGEIVEIGDAETVTTAPKDEYTRRLLLSALLPDPRRQAERRAVRRGEQESPAPADPELQEVQA